MILNNPHTSRPLTHVGQGRPLCSHPLNPPPPQLVQPGFVYVPVLPVCYPLLHSCIVTSSFFHPLANYLLICRNISCYHHCSALTALQYSLPAQRVGLLESLYHPNRAEMRHQLCVDRCSKQTMYSVMVSCVGLIVGDLPWLGFVCQAN